LALVYLLAKKKKGVSVNYSEILNLNVIFSKQITLTPLIPFEPPGNVIESPNEKFEQRR
jgi:hypothetical protein